MSHSSITLPPCGTQSLQLQINQPCLLILLSWKSYLGHKEMRYHFPEIQQCQTAQAILQKRECLDKYFPITCSLVFMSLEIDREVN